MNDEINPNCELSELFSYYEEDNILFLAMIRKVPDEKLNDHVSNLEKVKCFLLGLVKTDHYVTEIYEGFFEELILEQMVRNTDEGGKKDVRVIAYKNTTLGTIG